VADLAFILQLGQRADRLGDRHPGIGPVELVQVNPVQPQPAKAALAGPA
jgi:hypothetical protein